MKTLKLNNPEMAVYVKSMGKLFRVSAIVQTDDEANKIMRDDNGQAVIAQDCNGLIYIADIYGQKCPSQLVA